MTTGMGGRRRRRWSPVCCIVCGVCFPAARREAKTCGDRCRKRFSRARGYYEGLAQQQLSLERAVADGG
jgi:hypothetical protein